MSLNINSPWLKSEGDIITLSVANFVELCMVIESQIGPDAGRPSRTAKTELPAAAQRDSLGLNWHDQIKKGH